MAATRCSSVAFMVLLTCCCSAASAAGEGLTHLHFYMHEGRIGTPNATIVNVAGQHKNGTKFGNLNVLDDPLREGPDPASRLIGRAQGIAVHAGSLDDATGLVLTFDCIFSDYGEYSGSTLATTGHFNLSGPIERSIVGGTGRLRFARGYIISKFVSRTDTLIVIENDLYFTLSD